VPTVRVFHCDDSVAFRVLVREVLSDHPGLHVAGGAATLDEALAAVRDDPPDVVLLDLFDDRDEDLQVEQLREAAPAVKVLVYTGMPTRGGSAADGHVHKSRPFEELVRAIVEVAPVA
jgi:DNA-binding NarL/FixJ family response regulator